MALKECYADYQRKLDEDEKVALRISISNQKDIDCDPDDLLKSKGIVQTEQMRLAHNAGRSMMFDYCYSCEDELLGWFDVCPTCGENLLAQRMEG